MGADHSSNRWPTTFGGTVLASLPPDLYPLLVSYLDRRHALSKPASDDYHLSHFLPDRYPARLMEAQFDQPDTFHPQQFGTPFALACDIQGRIFVFDLNHHIYVHRPDGTFDHSFDTFSWFFPGPLFPDKQTQANLMDGTFNASGDLLLLNKYGLVLILRHKCGVYTSEDQVSRFGQRGRGQTELWDPRCLALTRSQDILVTDTENHRVQMYSPTGTWIRTIEKRGPICGGFMIEGLGKPTGIAVDMANGDIIVGKNNAIYIFSEDGTFKRTMNIPPPWSLSAPEPPHGRIPSPWAIKLDPRSGCLIIVDSDTGRVVIYDLKDDRCLKDIPGYMVCPRGCCIDGQGRILVTDQSPSIQVFG